jgi:molybdopterin/thiamine biosynthesis adenylyltransferase/rhodanese-related sulfurtransferase
MDVQWLAYADEPISPVEVNIPLGKPASAAVTALSSEELIRYSRHLLLPQVGEQGQLALKKAKVLVIGAGGLGSPVLVYLAAAGVGTLGIVDFDEVDLSNLHRQILHGSGTVGRPKVDSAVERLRDVNPNVTVNTFRDRFTAANGLEIARGYDIIVDGTDNFTTRYLVNDAAVLLGIPNVYGSVHRFEGQASVFGAKDGPCYRCLFREPPPADLIPNCAEAGVLGVLPGLIGTIQATEAVKMILGIGEPLVGRLLLIDAATMTFRSINVRKDPECPACGTREIRELKSYDELCTTGAESDSSVTGQVVEISPSQLAARLENSRDVDLIDVREPGEWRLGHIPGARLVPLGQIPDEIPRLDPARETIVYCKVGGRSRHAARQLVDAGIKNVSNLSGGILAWRDEIDPSLPKY